MGIQSSKEELLVVVGGGAAGVYGAIRAKTLAPNLDVLVIEKGMPLSKVMFLFLFLSFLGSCLYILQNSVCTFLGDFWRVDCGCLHLQVKISGGGRCNVTNGHCSDNKVKCKTKNASTEKNIVLRLCLFCL